MVICVAVFFSTISSRLFNKKYLWSYLDNYLVTYLKLHKNLKIIIKEIQKWPYFIEWKIYLWKLKLVMFIKHIIRVNYLFSDHNLVQT